MRHRGRIFWAVGSAAGLWLGANAALAQAPAAPGAAASGAPAATAPAAAEPTGNKQLAKELADRAQERFDAGDYEGAIASMTEAQKHARPPTFTRFLALAHEKLGRLVEAARLYREVAYLLMPDKAPDAWKRAQADAETALTALTKRIPTLQIELVGRAAGAVHVELDGKALDEGQLGAPLAVDPGAHTLVVRVAGEKDRTREVVSKEGTPEKVVVDVTPVTPAGPMIPAPPPPVDPRTSRLLDIGKYAALGVGGAGLVLGAVAGGVVLGEVDALGKGPCRLDLQRCDEGSRDRVEQTGTLADVATAGFVIGAVGVAAGVVLVLLPQKKAPAVGVAVGPGGVVVRGGF